MRKDGVFRRPLAWTEEKAPRLHRFLVRQDKPYPLIREAGGIALGLLLLVSLLWGLTGQPLHDSPVVVIESGSMMHCDQGANTHSATCQGTFGRLGTIDPGDLVFVRDTDGAGEITTFCQSARCLELPGGRSYLDAPCREKHHGSCGDVIIFTPDGDTARTPIIHRAMVWVEAHGDGVFSIKECGLVQVEQSELQNTCLARLGITGLHNKHGWQALGPDDSGFITRGDNNEAADQSRDQARLPVRPDWVLGKARGEVPWVGLVKLFVSDLFVGTDNFANAPGDTKVMMWVVVGVLVGAPFAIEQVVKMRQRKQDPPGGSSAGQAHEPPGNASAEEPDPPASDGGGRGPDPSRRRP